MLSEISPLQGGVMKSHVHLNHFLERSSITARFYFKTNRSKLKKHRKKMALNWNLRTCRSYTLFFWEEKTQPAISDLNFPNVSWSKKTPFLIQMSRCKVCKGELNVWCPSHVIYLSVQSMLSPILDDQTFTNLCWMMWWDKNVSIYSGNTKTNIMTVQRFENSKIIVLMTLLLYYKSTFVFLLWCCLCV